MLHELNFDDMCEAEQCIKIGGWNDFLRGSDVIFYTVLYFLYYELYFTFLKISLDSYLS